MIHIFKFKSCIIKRLWFSRSCVPYLIATANFMRVPQNECQASHPRRTVRVGGWQTQLFGPPVYSIHKGLDRNNPATHFAYGPTSTRLWHCQCNNPESLFPDFISTVPLVLGRQKHWQSTVHARTCWHRRTNGWDLEVRDHDWVALCHIHT